ncbi:hypothetical protein AK95_09250 [Paenibacillus sp. LC231]|uniref:sigma-70 family RNA polymerase sigma factor n=1 Tax=Paenibacillus sp. LC231 TaxID=1120679 RepID=UPI0008DC6904|nr:sigma-70 family RNA polymerase sigma factor [Paenibacillus sp. LC231]OIB03786.1 hypothetical protein AK95_09250 [Paenibacillus sp. LC231]
MFNTYQITGIQITGRPVNETLQAVSENHALSIIYNKYGKLADLGVSKISFLDAPFENMLEVKKYYNRSNYEDSDILEMLIQLKAKEGNQAHYEAVKEHFTPILNAAVSDYRYNDLSAADKEDFKDKLMYDIINEFTEKFSADRGRLLSFIKLKVRDRMSVYYDRKVNVNSNNKEKKRSRSEAVREYIEISTLPPQDEDIEAARLSLISTIQLIGNMDLKGIPRKRIEDTHERIVDLRLDYLLNLKRQREVYTLAYGPNRFKQRDIAELLNITQPTVSLNLKRAKRNIWVKIMKINLEAE